jgi:hypothetical protein
LGIMLESCGCWWNMLISGFGVLDLVFLYKLLVVGEFLGGEYMEELTALASSCCYGFNE